LVLKPLTLERPGSQCLDDFLRGEST